MSLKVENVKGNINRDESLHRLFHDLSSKGGVDRIFLQRREATKNRLRIPSERGRDVMIDVPRGTIIRHGDVLDFDKQQILIAEWLPEETMIVNISSAENWKERVEIAVKIGYILGIKHFQLFALGNEILIPIEGSKEDLSKALANFPGISTKVEKRILDPQPELTGYEHAH